MSLLKRLFCKHHFEFVRNIYGDEIIQSGYMRSIWHCVFCDAIKWGKRLEQESAGDTESAARGK